MKDGNCPKCSSTDVRTAERRSDFSWGDAAPSVRFGPSYSEVDTYLCIACGYVEHYVADPAKLADVAASWPSVSG
ncbi:MAG TPA: hypothetical protein VMQ81_02520 [Acidimicrobiia bacterium]|nr:hypothetical protein [Acidimicrobiia bacterium]